jgi:hypothetical protein
MLRGRVGGSGSGRLHGLPGRAPIKVADVELTASDATVLDLGDLRRYRAALVLVRLEGTPLGMLTLPVVDGACSRQALRAAVLRELADRIASKLLVDALLDPARASAPSVSSLRRRATPRQVTGWPSVVAFTDDDVVVHPGWVRALATVFAEDPEAMAVTGLWRPWSSRPMRSCSSSAMGGSAEDSTAAGTASTRGRASVRLVPTGSGNFGTGANMAYRRCVFDAVGLFDAALDVGTVTNGGGDLEMFFRVGQGRSPAALRASGAGVAPAPPPRRPATVLVGPQQDGDGRARVESAAAP